MPVIFDSNVWIALFNENDFFHQRAVQLFFENPVVYIPEYIVLEVTTVLQLRASKIKADLFVKMATATADVEILSASDELFQKTLTIFQQQNKKLSFIDCALVVLSNHYVIHTFDAVLAQTINDTQ